MTEHARIEHIDLTEDGGAFGIGLAPCPGGGGICHLTLPLPTGGVAQVCIPREIGGALGLCLTQLAAGMPFEALTRRH